MTCGLYDLPWKRKGQVNEWSGNHTIFKILQTNFSVSKIEGEVNARGSIYFEASSSKVIFFSWTLLAKLSYGNYNYMNELNLPNALIPSDSRPTEMNASQTNYSYVNEKNLPIDSAYFTQRNTYSCAARNKQGRKEYIYIWWPVHSWYNKLASPTTPLLIKVSCHAPQKERLIQVKQGIHVHTYKLNTR